MSTAGRIWASVHGSVSAPSTVYEDNVPIQDPVLEGVIDICVQHLSDLYDAYRISNHLRILCQASCL